MSLVYSNSMTSNKNLPLALEFFPALPLPSNEEQKIIHEAQHSLEQGSCMGKEFLGWLAGPSAIDNKARDFLQRLSRYSTLIVLGVGGSINGSRAIIEILQANYNLPLHGYGYSHHRRQKIFFAACDFDRCYHEELVSLMQGNQEDLQNWALLIISKSGTTREVEKAATVLIHTLTWLRGKTVATKNISQQIFLISDATSKQNTLWQKAQSSGWNSLASQPDIGGRFSLLSEVGWIPCAYTGIHTTDLWEGARKMRAACRRSWSLPSSSTSDTNLALQLAWFRYHNMIIGKVAQAYSCQRSSEKAFLQWMIQLFSESEGKNGRGVWPIPLHYSNDLHSVGQMLQDGPRNVYETQLIFPCPVTDNKSAVANWPQEVQQGLAEMQRMNEKLAQAVVQARLTGQVPVAQIHLKSLSAFALGGLVYLLHYSCAISALLLKVNPFNQPGVEEYKKNL